MDAPGSEPHCSACSVRLVLSLARSAKTLGLSIPGTVLLKAARSVLGLAPEWGQCAHGRGVVCEYNVCRSAQGKSARRQSVEIHRSSGIVPTVRACAIRLFLSEDRAILRGLRGLRCRPQFATEFVDAAALFHRKRFSDLGLVAVQHPLGSAVAALCQ